MSTLMGMVAVTSAVALLLAGVGFYPTRSLAGVDATTEMMWALAVTLASSWISLLPVALRWPTRSIAPLVLGTMAIRFVLVASASLTFVLMEWVDRPPFLVWVAISYVFLLVPDTLMVVRVARSDEGGD
ncbi:MAG: hypothetical protein ACPGXK_16840 [Phycisphaerae bacterium]